MTLLAVLGGGACNRSESHSPTSNAVATTGTKPPTKTTRPGLTAHAPDAFYDPPEHVPNHPGALLRSEPLKGVTLPSGVQGWRILYTTTVDDHTAATAVATVFAPAHLPAGPRPVIIWEHGTTGLLQKCMPSLTSAPAEGIPALDKIIAAGWVVVATDYSFAEKSGPHPYMIGEGEARAALDSARAVRQMPELMLDPRTVVWGHSQGGHAALWTGIAGPRYAPDVKIVGVAAIAPMANIKDIFAINVAVDQRLGPYLARAYSRFYPDVTFEQAVRPEALAAASEMANLCGFVPAEDPKRLAALAATLEGPALATDTNKALVARLEQNVPADAIAAPLLIAQGLLDGVVPAPVTSVWVEDRCIEGQRLEYWTFADRDHSTIVQPGTPLEEPLVAWTKARLADEEPPSGCTRKSF
jgi:pimeloyl-ACP methyl ester carboxylesterase